MASSDVDRLPLDSYLPTFAILKKAETSFVLVAGQAVNLWASHFRGKERRLEHFQPFVSKDVDLFGSPQDLARLGEVLSGTLVRFRDVRQPMIGTFTTDTDPILKIEVLRGIYGSVSNDKIVERAHTIGLVRVIDPVSLLAAKCHNLSGIDQENRQDGRHVQMMVLVARAYFLDILGEVGKAVTERQFINEVRYLLDLHAERGMRIGLSAAGFSLRECLQLSEITVAGEHHLKLARFTENALGKIFRSTD